MSVRSEPSVTGSGAAGATESGFYARKASGLVRDLGLREAVLLNLCWISVPLGLVYITQIGGLFPGASVGLAFLLAGVIALPHLYVYGNFAGAMPRSGGDYLSISRSIHPFVGFIVDSTFTVLQIFSTAFIINFIPLFALPSFFQTLAIITGDHSWASAAANVSTETGQFLIATGIIVLMGVLMIFWQRFTLRLFTVLMVLSLIGVITTIIALIFIDQSQLAHGFAKFGGVSKVISEAHKSGFGSSTFSLSVTFAAITIMFGAIGLGQVSSYFAGEIRQPGKTIFRGMLISVTIAAVGLALIAFLADKAFGATFINSAQYLSNNGKWPVPASPFVNLFIGIAAPHTWLAIVLGVATVGGIAAIAVPTYLMATRNMLAYSFDRVLPTKVSEVNDRTHTPIIAVVIVMVLMIGFQAGFVYSAANFAVYLGSSGIVVFVTFAIVGIAAILFPYRRKDMYDDSPIPKGKLGGIPLFAVVGIVDGALMTLYCILNFTNGDVTGATNHTALLVLLLLVVVLSAVWVTAFVAARRRGLDLDVVQNQLPPE
jgi:basic amino acid/polyamine antiporter, APA family